MTEWKTVGIFALLCCATQVARASLVWSSSTGFFDAQNPPIILASIDSPSANWSVPASLNLHPSVETDLQSSPIGAADHIQGAVSLWVASPTELSQGGTSSGISSQMGDFHASPATMPLMSIASVAIPLPLALPAGIVGLVFALFFSFLWKKHSRLRD